MIVFSLLLFHVDSTWGSELLDLIFHYVMLISF